MKLSCNSFKANKGKNLPLWCIIPEIQGEQLCPQLLTVSAANLARARGITPISAVPVNHSPPARGTSAARPARPQLADGIIPAPVGREGCNSDPRERDVAGSSSQDQPSDSDRDVE